MILLTSYILIGFLFGILFVLNGYAAIEPDAKGSPFRFRILLLPACLLLWPYLAWRWLRAPS